jgi:hypothetical protein
MYMLWLIFSPIFLVPVMIIVSMVADMSCCNGGIDKLLAKQAIQERHENGIFNDDASQERYEM